MKLRANRGTERAGVNAAQSFFEANGYVFQPVGLENDYGKDAYVDTTHGDKVTGFCIALQVKSGDSFRRADGYAIPCDESHEEVWRTSTIPIAGIVYDPADQKLRWCNISEYLDIHKSKVTSIPVPKNQILIDTSLRDEFEPSFRKFVEANAGGRAILSLCSVVGLDEQIANLLDCFAFGRKDAREFIALRYLLRLFDGEPLAAAVHILSHVTPHPDIIWGAHNWVPDEICRLVRSHLRWSVDEVCWLLEAVPWNEEWTRGGLGESLYMLLKEDDEIQSKLEGAAVHLVRRGSNDAAFAALYVSTYLARADGPAFYDALTKREPLLENLDLISDVQDSLAQYGGLSLFE